MQITILQNGESLMMFSRMYSPRRISHVFAQSTARSIPTIHLNLHILTSLNHSNPVPFNLLWAKKFNLSVKISCFIRPFSCCFTFLFWYDPTLADIKLRRRSNNQCLQYAHHFPLAQSYMFMVHSPTSTCTYVEFIEFLTSSNFLFRLKHLSSHLLMK